MADNNKENWNDSGIIDVLDTGTGERKELTDFIEEWGGGVLTKAMGGELLTPEEQATLTDGWLSGHKGYRLQRRYYDERGHVHYDGDEMEPVIRFEGTPFQGRLERRSGGLLEAFIAARKAATEAIKADDARRASRQAEEHADRYQRALADLDAMDARKRLKDRIVGMEDTQQRREWIARYPELFSADAAGAMAAQDRAREQRELWESAGGTPTFVKTV